MQFATRLVWRPRASFYRRSACRAASWAQKACYKSPRCWNPRRSSREAFCEASRGAHSLGLFSHGPLQKLAARYWGSYLLGKLVFGGQMGPDSHESLAI